MKLKFRAESKDAFIFALYAIFLLYLVAIVVLNAVSFVGSNVIHGLNPFPAFERDLIGPTMTLYIIALIASFASVSSHFFEREKGIGVKIAPKKDKGYSRWSTDKEMKAELKMVHPQDEHSDVAGIPLINNGKEIWVDDGSYHNLIIGSTGSGKTEMLVQPMVKILAKKGESMIITDPKGEIYENNANELRERGYNIILLNFRDPQKGNCWNPLTLPYSLYKQGNSDKANELLDDLAKNILYDESSKGNDPFWENTSADYFAGLSLALFDDAKEEEINLNSINLMTTVGEEKVAGSIYMKEYFSDKPQTSAAYVNVASTLMAPSETKGSILSVFKQKIKLFSSRENLSEMLSHSDFDMEDIGRKKTAVFIVIQDEKKTYHSLVTIFIKQCYETLIGVAQQNGGKLSYRTNFILDEFANMPPLKDVTTMVTAARSRKIRFNFIIQNFAQLNQVYGKENGETIKGNCGNIIYLISSELAALEEISKMCGEVKSKKDDKTASTPLVTVSDLQRMKMWSIIVVRIRMMPYKTVMTPNFKMEDSKMWGKEYGKSDYPERERHTVPVFDLKAVVDAKRQKKMNEMFGSMGDMANLPNFPGMPGMNSMMGNTPMMGNNSMMGGNSLPPFPGLPGMNPFAGIGSTQSEPTNGGFNVDELVKRIDAKIAELEEEERLEKEKEANTLLVSDELPDHKVELPPTIKVEETEKQELFDDMTMESVEIPDFLKEEASKKEPKFVSDEKSLNDITDDQFFDDFFHDEDE